MNVFGYTLLSGDLGYSLIKTFYQPLYNNYFHALSPSIFCLSQNRNGEDPDGMLQIAIHHKSAHLNDFSISNMRMKLEMSQCGIDVPARY